ncbi:biotin transporter BioY [Limosilactobacillus caecicola]|uniref:biotin transporter BioY n=1 Tax=Limosilactobacillus caecicola TaxID=2941332 RepID=UPI0020404623|nr:biotin transporter BioY [Limosilactobacillus caecicola]
MKVRTISRDAILFALLIIASQISLPLPGIPLTLQTFMIGLIATLVPVPETLVIIASYLVLGTLGLPVFSNFTGGLSILLSPLGGFLIGFLVYGIVTSGLLSWWGQTTWPILLANLIGALLQLLIGTWWFKLWNHLSWFHASAVAFWPFVLPGLIKLGLLMLVAPRLLRALNHLNH